MIICASIAGYNGQPTSLSAFFDHKTNILVIDKAVQYREERQEGEEDWAFVTNVRCPAYDSMFQEEHLADAVSAFKAMEGAGTVILGDDVAKYKPRVESDGVDDKGQKWRLHADMSNGEVAVLALVHFLERQRGVNNALDAMDEFMDLISI